MQWLTGIIIGYGGEEGIMPVKLHHDDEDRCVLILDVVSASIQGF